MPQPTPFERSVSFTDFSVSFPALQQPGDKLDVEFNGIKETLDGILNSLALIQRDDGALRNESVTPESLHPGTKALFMTGGATAMWSFNGRNGEVELTSADVTDALGFTPTDPDVIADLNKAIVGLSNVDNTSDADKPVSIAQAEALATKANATFVPPEAGPAVGVVAELSRGPLRVARFPGATDVQRITNAFAAAPDGATVLFEPGKTSVIDSLIQVGGADGSTGKNLRVIAEGHTFLYTTNGARIEFNAPISAVLPLQANYAKGSTTLRVSHTGAQLADFKRDTWIKVVTDAIDGWNRNQGTQAGQYRLAEFAMIRKVVDNGNGTADLTLWNPLKFTRGFVNTGDAENLSEVDAYTVANATRIIALKKDAFEFRGGKFACDNPNVGVGGWDTRALLRVQGYANPIIDTPNLEPGAGKGIELSGCVNFVVNNARVGRLPDFAEQAANDGIVTTYIGYGVAIAGCWGGVINNMVAKDCRHAITESNSQSSAGSNTYGILLSIGRTYGTGIVNLRGGGQYSSVIDTHHGAHGWIIVNPVIEGVQGTYCINLRGPDHVVIGGQLTGKGGINVLSEYDNDGGVDLPALVGNGNKWMSSARAIGVNIDCTHEAVRAQVGYITLEGGAKIRSRSHYVFNAQGGVIDFASGRFDVEVTGETTAQAANANDGVQRGFFQTADVDASYGATWNPGVIIREGANVDINGAAAADGVTMSVFNQTGANGQVTLKGGLAMTLPAAGVSASVFGGNLYWTIDRGATLDLTGNAGVTAAFPKWDKGKTRIANLATGVAQKLFTFKDGLGGLGSFVAMMRVYVIDAGSAAMIGEFHIQDSMSGGSSVENTFLLSGNAALEANNNVDLSAVAPSAGKIGFSYINGAVYARHDIAATVYEDVFAEFVIHRQPART